MTFKRLFLALVLLITTLSSQEALAWNSIGHMAVAYAAYQKLTPAERARVSALLQLNPYYRKWLSCIPAGASPADRDMYVFMMAATWPDKIKAMGSHYEGTDTPPKGESAALNDGYAAHRAHKYWHYVNTPIGASHPGTAPLTTPNVTEKIAAFRTALATREPDALKSYDLVWLLHLVGDVHQPLHCVTRVSAANPKGDQGGNLVVISGPDKKLHAFWDSILGNGDTRDFITAIKVARTLPAPDSSLVSDRKEDDWTAEGYALAKSAVYVEPVGPGLGPYTLTAAYAARALQIAKQRVSLAGARLALLLKGALQCGSDTCAH
jgi:hypothetical protein